VDDRQLTRLVRHKYLGEEQIFTVPWRFGDTTAGACRPAPLLGADTADVVAELAGDVLSSST
jgi:crotonobetainyl-CoA:carnitine CoA-transferase CaiB-like acyl-CoA transferase